jgi:antibiotic biosynthesis monooxygenase (ABM) superfamily enzyme
VHQSYSPSDPVTVIISEVVDPNQLDEYETWTHNINHAAQQFEGFIAIEVLRPRDNAHAEYVVIVRFDSYEHLRAWVTSDEYRYWIHQSRGFIEKKSVRHMTQGLEIWFSSPQDNLTQENQPPYYKKVIVGVLAVYPLILLSNFVLGHLLAPLPPKLGLLISVVFVSGLLTYPVMPMLTHLLDFWLYPASDRTP